MAAASSQGPSGGGGSAPNTNQQSQDIELQGIKAEGVLGGLPVAERNQDFFLVFKGIGGTGPEIIGQTAYFIEYLVDSEGNVFKPSENTSALINLLQNFQVNKNVNVIVDNPSTTNAIMAGQHQLTAIGVQQPILYSQTGSSVGAFTGSVFFEGDTTLGVIGNDGTLVVPDMQAYMLKTTSLPSTAGVVTGFNSFIGGTPSDTSGNARSASLTTGRYVMTSSALADLNTFKLQATAKVKNTTNSSKNLSLAIAENGNSIAGSNSVTIPANSGFINVTVIQEFTSQFATQNLLAGEFIQLVMFGNGMGDLTFESIKFGNPGGPLFQNPTPNGNLLQSAGSNAPPFWLTGSNGSLYITASDYLSTNYANLQITSGSINIGGDNVNITNQFKDFNLSKIQVPFKTKIGDRIRFLYNSQTDFHIYDVKEPNDEVDGRLKLKLNTNLSQSLTETQLSNFVLHRTNESIPRYIILNVDKVSGVDSAANPFTGVILPEFPTENLVSNLDSILNKLKLEGIIEN